jgi:hypothetical protein
MNNMVNDYFEIKESELSFGAVLKDENLSQVRISELQNSQMLFLPIRKYRKEEGYFFHSAMRDFYLICKNESPNNHFDFCTEKNNYKELSLNGSELFLGTLLIKDVVLPIFINLISNYIHEKLRNSDDKINVNIIIEDKETEKNHEIAFRGTKIDFERKVINALQTYSKEGKINLPEQKGIKIDVLS